MGSRVQRLPALNAFVVKLASFAKLIEGFGVAFVQAGVVAKFDATPAVVILAATLAGLPGVQTLNGSVDGLGVNLLLDLSQERATVCVFEAGWGIALC